MCVCVCVDKLQTRLLSLGSKVPVSSHIVATYINEVLQTGLLLWDASYVRQLECKGKSECKLK
jgi:hypothetical protein